MNHFYRTGFDGSRNAKEINLRELLQVLIRRIVVILIVTIIASAAGAVKSTLSVKNLYESSARIIIGADDQSRTTLQVIIRDNTVLDEVIRKLNLHTSSEILASQITVSSIDNSQVVSISVVDSNPVTAAKIADTTATVFKEEVPKIVGKNSILLLSKAKVNPTPINNEHKRTFFIYMLGGLFLGIGLAFFLDSMDHSIRSEEQVENVLSIPVLGKVSKMKKKNVKRNKKEIEFKFRGETFGSE